MVAIVGRLAEDVTLMTDAGATPPVPIGEATAGPFDRARLMRALLYVVSASGAGFARLAVGWPPMRWLAMTPAVGGALCLGAQSGARYLLGQLRSAPGRQLGRLARVEAYVAVLWPCAAALEVYTTWQGPLGLAVHSFAAAVLAVLLVLTVVVEGAIVHVLVERDAPRLQRLLGEKRPFGVPLASSLMRWEVPETRRLVKAKNRLIGKKRQAVSALTVGIVCCLAATAATAATRPLSSAISPMSPRRGRSPVTKVPHLQGGIASGSSRVSAPTTGAPTTSTFFADLCGRAPTAQPGEGAEWASQALHDLYFAPGSGLGAEIAGCPQPVETVTDAGDSVKFQRGLTDEALRSVALDSRTHGSVMFIGETAAIALSYLRDGVAVSGSHRVDVGNGDVQLLYTRHGTVALVRARKVESGSASTPERYIELPEAAVTAWRIAMVSARRWLWPNETVVGTDGERHFALSPTVDGRALATVTVDQSGLNAVLTSSGEEVRLAADGVAVPVDDLTAVAPNAKRG